MKEKETVWVPIELWGQTFFVPQGTITNIIEKYFIIVSPPHVTEIEVKVMSEAFLEFFRARKMLLNEGGMTKRPDGKIQRSFIINPTVLVGNFSEGD
ncbi:MAG: hypothetical protein GF349_01015 [Candidatus Magasanikbacteria bacterium]|nr:hypothetical protein [Candidatus Magasanikbacteria bacterium]